MDLSKNTVRDVSPLCGLQHLLTLNVSANSISSLRALQSLPYLQLLNVSQNKLGALEGCSHPLLEHLIANGLLAFLLACYACYAMLVGIETLSLDEIPSSFFGPPPWDLGA